ncbi:MAG: DUF4258 domain-containing protein [Chloroflexi bacterium]|nr:DUF4258 domain-containing protein [Chloroflexota bacterium]MBI3742423.1 DUF4258 domain-containing protein [Chloroflexota bacterium]
MPILERIRYAVREQDYRISAHANEEMSEDYLTSEDVEKILLSGQIKKRFSRDPRGTRYEIAGKSTDGRRANVVCRFLPSQVLSIITAFVEEKDRE